MTLAEAKRILESIPLTVLPDCLLRDEEGNHECVGLVDGRSNIDWWASADELEAIACWMRDPRGVSET